MKTLWKGAVSFGLVNIPISMYAATENKDIRFNYLHRDCMSPIKYQKFCPRCQKEISSEEIVRGYEYSRGNYVVIEDGDLERIPRENTKTIDILDFVNLSQVDPVFFDKTYYLEASPGGEKAYSLIVEAMNRTNKIAIAKILIRSKESLAVLRAKEGYLLMETIFYPDEIRSPLSLNRGLEHEKLHENEMKMAVSLIENLSTDFDPARYEDNYRKALWEIIEARISGQEIVTPERGEDTGKVVDLMEALKASIKLAEQNRKGENEKAKVKKPKKKVKSGV